MQEIVLIRNVSTAQGYWKRCTMLLGILDSEISNDAKNLYRRLSKVNGTQAVEDTQLACRYTAGASESEAWNACMRMVEILRGSKLTMSEIKDMQEEDFDVEDYFESHGVGTEE